MHFGSAECQLTSSDITFLKLLCIKNNLPPLFYLNKFVSLKSVNCIDALPFFISYHIGLRWTCHVSDDGAFYFDEKTVRGSEHQGSLSTTSSVVRGVTAFSAVTSGKINVSKERGIAI